MRFLACALAAYVACWSSKLAQAEHPFPFIFPEQRSVQVRDPSELRAAPIPNTPPPPTVLDLQAELPERNLSLDEAIRSAIANSRVVRVLGGVTAVSSGRTIYDAAIINNGIDEQQARFDPVIRANNSFNRLERPQAVFDPLNPGQSLITGTRTDNYNLDASVSKTTVTGGTLNLGVNTTPTRFQPGVFPLNPATGSSVDLSLTQPLLQGGGLAVNRVPIVLARIDTERSFFQFKDATQELVRGVIQVYWSVVFARTDLWARQRQVEQAQHALELVEGQHRVGIVDIGPVAQARVALNNFRANAIAAQASLLQQEAALRSLLGFPPSDTERIVPTTPPRLEQVEVEWEELLQMAQQQRPDLIELKLILEADEQLLLQAENQASPRVDGVALYRWNGLEGEMPNGADLSSGPGQFTDWTLGVNFSVPLFLRQSRAGLRQRELILSRDEANLEQGVLTASHILAANLRNLALYYEQYRAFRDVRVAAERNLELQMQRNVGGIVIFLNVLQAITDWGNAVSAEAQSLLQYNAELANLERQTGTILEAHQIRFYEERYGSLSPLGRFHQPRCYPNSLPPTLNDDRYPTGDRPAEDVFDLKIPDYRNRESTRQPEVLRGPP